MLWHGFNFRVTCHKIDFIGTSSHWSHQTQECLRRKDLPWWIGLQWELAAVTQTLKIEHFHIPIIQAAPMVHPFVIDLLCHAIIFHVPHSQSQRRWPFLSLYSDTVWHSEWYSKLSGFRPFVTVLKAHCLLWKNILWLLRDVINPI